MINKLAQKMMLIVYITQLKIRLNPGAILFCFFENALDLYQKYPELVIGSNILVK